MGYGTGTGPFPKAQPLPQFDSIEIGGSLVFGSVVHNTKKNDADLQVHPLPELGISIGFCFVTPLPSCNDQSSSSVHPIYGESPNLQYSAGFINLGITTTPAEGMTCLKLGFAIGSPVHVSGSRGDVRDIFK